MARKEIRTTVTCLSARHEQLFIVLCAFDTRIQSGLAICIGMDFPVIWSFE